MKKSWMVALIAVVVLALTSPVFAAAAPSAKPATAAKPTMPAHAVGTLASVDAKANTLALQVKSGRIEFTLNPTTEYLSAGKSATLASLTPGAHLRVEYTKAGTQRTATKVEVLSSPAKP